MAPVPWLSTDEIVERLAVAKDPVYIWNSEKVQPTRRGGRVWRFRVGEIDDWIRNGGAVTTDSS